jgi:hypothetical protein
MRALHLQRSLQLCRVALQSMREWDETLGVSSEPWPTAAATQITLGRRCGSEFVMRLHLIDCSLRFRTRIVALAEILALAASLTVGFAPSAQALPSFARQTGQPCGTCHTDFPALTPYGRRFKLLGYTTGGGEFRTNPFSSQIARDARAEYDKMMGYVKALPQTKP